MTITGVIAAMAAIAMPNYLRILQTDRLAAASRDVVSQLRVVQSLAVKSDLSGRYYRFAVDAGQPNSYRIEMSADNVAWPLPTDTVASTAGAAPRVILNWVSLSGEYPGVAMATPNTVPFNFRGAVENTGGNIVIGLAAASGAKTITVNHAGVISVQ
jgi:Tfp pilus assembly protein FimT